MSLQYLPHYVNMIGHDDESVHPDTVVMHQIRKAFGDNVFIFVELEEFAPVFNGCGGEIEFKVFVVSHIRGFVCGAKVLIFGVKLDFASEIYWI